MKNNQLNRAFNSIGIVFLCFMFSSCTYSQSSKSFDEFKSSFPIIERAINIDSLALRNTFKSNNQIAIVKDDYHYIKLSFFNEECNGESKYTHKKYGKIELDDKVVLLYLVELNKDCPTDANELYYVVCLYDSKGNLIEDKIIGQIYEVFGRSEYKYFKLSIDESKVNVEVNTIEEIMDDANPDIIHKNKSVDTIVW